MITQKGKFAYVTVGGENEVKVFRRGQTPELVATIPTGDLPHGIWGSGDGTKVYVGLENQDAVSAISTLTNQVLATIPVGQQPQALVYVAGSVPDGGGTTNLIPLGEAGQAAHLALVSPEPDGRARATVSVNAVGSLDLLQVAVAGLKPGETYTLWITAGRVAPFGKKERLATFKANLAGAQIIQTVGPLRSVLTHPTDGTGEADERRFLLVTPASGEAAVLVQQE